MGGDPEATDDEYGSLADALKALSNPKRLRILRFLVHPHYLEEIASELGVARQTAQEHVQVLLDVGVVQPVRGRREHAAVTDYVIVPARLFALHERFGALAGLTSDLGEEVSAREPTSPSATGPAEPRERDLPRLTIVHGMRVGRTVVLSGAGPWVLGRDPHALVCLDYDPYASTRHAEVRRAEGGGFEVADMYSRNGTLVDWERLPRGTARRLADGSLLGVGKTLLHFRRGGV